MKLKFILTVSILFMAFHGYCYKYVICGPKQGKDCIEVSSKSIEVCKYVQPGFNCTRYGSAKTSSPNSGLNKFTFKEEVKFVNFILNGEVVFSIPKTETALIEEFKNLKQSKTSKLN